MGSGAVLAFMMLATGCTGQRNETENAARSKVQSVSVSESSAADDEAATIGEIVAESNAANASEVDAAIAEPNGDNTREDISVRASVQLAEGQLVVKPTVHATVSELGVPSCLGLESDLNWRGTFEADWIPKDGEAERVFTFPREFEMIQPSESPVGMERLELNDVLLLAFSPRYTDCRMVETYFFGMKDGKAFPVPIIMSDTSTLTSIGQYPHRKLEVKQDEVIAVGGFGAGMDAVPVYHLRYDGEKKALVLTKTDLLPANELDQ
ncbi:hypothetical protein JOC55_002443 [Paenibacillus sacheonensis]|nr:hypothetical protein [Paenibacillus sacheonensis]